MIYKNDEHYKLTAEDIRLIRARFPKFPVRLIYPEERVRPPQVPSNILPDKPNSISFPLRAVVKTPTGTDVWIYAENRLIDNHGRYIYTPHNFILFGTAILQENDMELIWYLYTKCPFVEGGLNFQGKAKATFEDLVSKAEEKARREAAITDVKALIYSTKLGLPENKLRQIAKALFIPDVDEMTFSQVKVAIEQEIMRSKDGVFKFMNMIDSEEHVKIRTLIQEAIDRKFIKFVPSKRSWVWVAEPGKKNEEICEITIGTDPYEALMDLYKGNAKFANRLHALLKGKKVVLAQGADEPLNDEEPE
ncbi:MAG TPA: hypothetical protein PLH43_09440 [Acetivibrio sp.]|uniref:hypothetical protein n=1 Tax=Acetivibrio sp. TaxID=1872092 RepID=UPI002BC470AD|nr:hypothetical protein [Acetivibrio sp.]HOM03036.1 hypothetical protein [Acetivibrio sp.]